MSENIIIPKKKPDPKIIVGVVTTIGLVAFMVWWFKFRNTKKEGDSCIPEVGNEIVGANTYVLNSNLECNIVSDCYSGNVLVNNTCLKIGSNCSDEQYSSGNTCINKDDNWCASETSNLPKWDPTAKSCRTLQQSDCLDTEYVNSDGTLCVTKNSDWCASQDSTKPIWENNECRALIASDCLPETQYFEDGVCYDKDDEYCLKQDGVNPFWDSATNTCSSLLEQQPDPDTPAQLDQQLNNEFGSDPDGDDINGPDADANTEDELNAVIDGDTNSAENDISVPVTEPAPTQQCVEPRILSDKGNCVCPHGSRFVDNVCMSENELSTEAFSTGTVKNNSAEVTNLANAINYYYRDYPTLKDKYNVKQSYIKPEFTNQIRQACIAQNFPIDTRETNAKKHYINNLPSKNPVSCAKHILRVCDEHYREGRGSTQVYKSGFDSDKKRRRWFNCSSGNYNDTLGKKQSVVDKKAYNSAYDNDYPPIVGMSI